LDKGKDSKKVKVAIVERAIQPSQQTFNQIYAEANKFASENRTYEQFNAAVTKQKLAKKLATNIGENDKGIPGLEQPRPVLRWMYKTDKREVSEPLDLGDRYVVAVLTAIREKGTAPIEQVKADVELQVRKEKKAEKLAEQINKVKSGSSSIQDLGVKLNIPVEVANGITFSTYALPNAGIEPKVVSVATVLEKNKISEPVNGNNGVYVLSVSNVMSAPESKDYFEAKQRMENSFQARASYDSYNALRKLADIVDKRAKFY
jgi:peptidyl-prolyl cis-trans isomerase D